MFDWFRTWREQSLKNTLSFQGALIVLVTAIAVSVVSVAILFWVNRAAIKGELENDGSLARERLEEPLRVVEGALRELAQSALLMTALTDSSGRAAYVQPYLHNFAFPISAPNGMALCDINGVRIAGTSRLSECHPESPLFAWVLADGITRRTIDRDARGRLIWRVYAGITFSYTGTIEGVAVAQVDLDKAMDQVSASLPQNSITLNFGRGRDEARWFADLVAPQAVVPLFREIEFPDATMAALTLVSRHSSFLPPFLPLLVGFLGTTLALTVGVIFRVRASARQLTRPLIALRDRAQEISATGDLSLSIPRSTVDEVGQLGASIEEMIVAIREAEKSRREAEERFRLIFEKSREAILFGWPDGRIEMANPELKALFALGNTRVSDWKRNDFFDLTDPRFDAALAIREKTGLFRGELTCIDAKGRRFPAEVVSSVFIDSKGETRSTTLIRDISERKQAEAERLLHETWLTEMSRRIVAVQEDARRRLARELHDSTSPALAAININLEVLSMMVRETNQREIEERLADTRALVDDTAFGIREISAELRPAALDYAGLSSALEDYLEQFARRSGIAVVADLHPLNGRTSAAEETALFRIA